VTTDYAAEVARLNLLTEQALAKYGEESQDRKFADHTTLMLGLLDEWITRAQEIDTLRAESGKRPADRSETVAAFEQRLTTLRSLLHHGQ
jgi:hypothetical protein